MKAPAHFFAIRKVALPLIESYHADLLKIDRRMMRRHPDIPFIHTTRAWGTYLDLLYPPDHPFWPKDDFEEVPYLFATANRRRILEQTGGSILYALKPQNDSHGQRPLVIHHFDGTQLRTITPSQAKQLVTDYRWQTGVAWSKSRDQWSLAA